MSGFVLDASSVLAWCFEDEAGPEVDAMIERAAAEGALVPSLWPLEVANALVAAERRNRIARTDSESFVSLLEELPITIDASTAAHAFRETIILARDHGLSAYDAAYLELALRAELPLATNDRTLRRAATALGVAG